MPTVDRATADHPLALVALLLAACSARTGAPIERPVFDTEGRPIVLTQPLFEATFEGPWGSAISVAARPGAEATAHVVLVHLDVAPAISSKQSSSPASDVHWRALGEKVGRATTDAWRSAGTDLHVAAAPIGTAVEAWCALGAMTLPGIWTTGACERRRPAQRPQARVFAELGAEVVAVGSINLGVCADSEARAYMTLVWREWSAAEDVDSGPWGFLVEGIVLPLSTDGPSTCRPAARPEPPLTADSPLLVTLEDDLRRVITAVATAR